MTSRPEPQLNAQTPAPPAQAVPAPAPARASATARPVRNKAPSGADTGASNNAAATAPAPIVITMAELPVAIQQELPPMSISVHAYSGNASQRLVDINGRLLHEGADVAPGLRLEQITPEGMILSYKGYTFRRGVH
jgi:general secretion pathway protein B